MWHTHLLHTCVKHTKKGVHIDTFLTHLIWYATIFLQCISYPTYIYYDYSEKLHNCTMRDVMNDLDLDDEYTIISDGYRISSNKRRGYFH